MRFEDLIGSRYFFNTENPSGVDFLDFQEGHIANMSGIVIQEVTESWDYSFSRYWVSFKPKGRKIPKVGWKIHISLQLEELHRDLPPLFESLVRSGVPFKCVRGIKMYRLLLDKNSDRRQCGKAITVYPHVPDIPNLIDMLGELEFSPGPTVITDLPTLINGVSLRYGFFIPSDSAEEQIEKEEPNTHSFEDNRQALDPAAYDIENCPKEIKEVIDISPQKYFSIQNVKALKQCGAGGVYSALYKGKNIIIKQGRRYTGYDDTHSDGASRIEHECNTLSQLSAADIEIAPKVINYTALRDDVFLFLERIEGVSLHEWKRDNYPLYPENRLYCKRYLFSVKCIVAELVDALENLHQQMLSHNDIHTRNVMWDVSRKKLRLIDFESCRHVRSTNGLYSPKAAGYYRVGLTDGFESDWYGASQILQELIFSNVTHLDMDATGVHKGWTQGYVDIRESDPKLWAELKEMFVNLRRRSGQVVKLPLNAEPIERLSQSTKSAISFLKTYDRIDSTYPHQIKVESNSLLFGSYIKWRQLPKRDYISLTGKAWELKNASQISISPGGLVASAHLDYLFTEYFLRPGRSGVVNSPTWKFEVLRIVESVLSGRDPLFNPINMKKLKRLGIPFYTGLIYGYLSYAFPISRLLAHGNLSELQKSRSLDALKLLLLREFNEYTGDDVSGLQAKVSGRLLPYLATGSAGFGPVLAGLSKYREALGINNQVRQLLKASTPLTCNSMGLFNGYAGLALGASFLSDYLSEEYNSEEAIEHLGAMSVEVVEGDNSPRLSLCSSDGGYRISTDFATGTLGVDFAVAFLTSPSAIPPSLTEFAKSVLPEER